MNIYVIDRHGEPPSNAQRPFFSLMRDNWDDFNYQTTFILYFHFLNEHGEKRKREIGPVKILQKGVFSPDLSAKFKFLDEKFCSLGQEPIYYERLSTIASESRIFLLKGIRDVVAYEEIYREFKDIAGFSTSLLRQGTARKALEQGKRILQGLSGRNSDMSFEFHYKVENAKSEHKVKFDFSFDANLPFRLNAIIGKNGTGKTQCLSRLAHVLSDQKSDLGRFPNAKPVFEKVIAISYSAFDTFERPENTNIFSYKYCGLQSDEGLLNKKLLIKNINTALVEVYQNERNDAWIDKIAELTLNESVLELKSVNKELTFNRVFKEGLLSSGQMIIVSILTDIIANIRNESLILFDEPENHLHPNATSSLMKALYGILETFNSYAIVCTHSPLLIREVPRKYIRVFEKYSNGPLITLPEIETFGQSVTELTNYIFDVREEESLFKSRLREMSKKLTEQEILNIFEDSLGVGARIFLKSLSDEKS